jgi:hypothetical protein
MVGGREAKVVREVMVAMMLPMETKRRLSLSGHVPPKPKRT